VGTRFCNGCGAGLARADERPRRAVAVTAASSFSACASAGLAEAVTVADR